MENIVNKGSGFGPQRSPLTRLIEKSFGLHFSLILSGRIAEKAVRFFLLHIFRKYMKIQVFSCFPLLHNVRNILSELYLINIVKHRNSIALTAI